MKRVEYLKLGKTIRKKRDERSIRGRAWDNLVMRFKSQAVTNLKHIYQQVTGVSKPRKKLKIVENDVDTLIDVKSDQILIGQALGSTVRWDHQIYKEDGSTIPYPYENEQLWPWTAANAAIPYIPTDVWHGICSFLPIGSAIRLSAVSKELKTVVYKNKIWQWF